MHLPQYIKHVPYINDVKNSEIDLKPNKNFQKSAPRKDDLHLRSFNYVYYRPNSPSSIRFTSSWTTEEFGTESSRKIPRK